MRHEMALRVLPFIGYEMPIMRYEMLSVTSLMGPPRSIIHITTSEIVEEYHRFIVDVVRAAKERLRQDFEDFLRWPREVFTYGVVRIIGDIHASEETSRLPGEEGVMMSVQGKLQRKGHQLSASVLQSGGGSGTGGIPDDRDKPFPKEIQEKARKITKGYTISVRQLEQHGYVGCPIELPTIEGYGDTPQACYESTRDAVEFTVATMLEAGEVPPLPAAAEQRTAQVNVKLTPLEKDMFSTLAQRLGYKGLSDFIRSTVLRVFNAP